MIKPRYHPFYIWFFNHYTRISVEKHFSKISIAGSFTDQNKPILVIGNHFSWWDGFFAHYLNMKLLGRRYNVMMLEKELKQRMFLNKIGAFSIAKGRRSMVDSIRLIEELLNDKKNLVVYYAQGQFQSIYESQVNFEKGINTILSRLTKSDIQVFFYAALVDYFNEKKPSLSFYIDEFRPGHSDQQGNIESAYNTFYQQSIKKQILKG